MACTTRPLHDHQQRALAAAAGLVGRPRLRAGLALTLAFACGPLPAGDDPDEGGDTGLTDAASTLAPTTGAPTSTGLDDTGTGDAASTGDASTGLATTGGTLLTDASTTLATDTGDTTTADTTTGATTGSTGELDDCVLDHWNMLMDWACCEAQNWEPAPQCTPWGPPAPPAADRLLQARMARRVLA